MNSRPLVSIVIPVYNGSDYLREAVESALNQIYPDVEVLVINDGSTDNGKTERIALGFGKRIRYFPKKNGGVASALNKGITEMKGDYFSWLSHDDVYVADKIDRQMKAMASAGRDVILHAGYDYIDRHSVFIKKGPRMQGLTPDNFRVRLITDYCINGCTALVPKRAFEELGLFDERLSTTQDFDAWFRFAGRYQFVYMPEVVLLSRLHPDQGTLTMREKVYTECNDLYRSFLDSVKPMEVRAGGYRSMTAFYFHCSDRLSWKGFDKAASYALGRALEGLGRNSAGQIPGDAADLARYGMRKILSALRTRIRKASVFRAFPQKLFVRGAQVLSCTLYPLFCPGRRIRKISVVAEYDSLGGTMIFVRNLLGFLNEKGISTVLHPVCPPANDPLREYAKEKKTKYEPLLPSLHGLHYIREATFSALRFWLRERPDAIIVSMGTPGWFLHLFLLPVRILYVLHSVPLAPLPPDQKLLLTGSLGRHKAIMTVSGHARERISELWTGSKQNGFVRFVYNTPGPNDLVEDAEAGPVRLKVLTIGNVVQYKNPMLWIEVAAEITKRKSNVDFEWVGDGPMTEECRMLVAEKGLTDRVRFSGPKPQASKLLTECAVYFQPSITESHGIAVLEAMRAGRPCVVTNAGGLAESVEDGKTGMVVNHVPEECITALEALLENRELRARMGAAGKARYAEKFSYGKWAAGMENILRGIA